MPIFSSKLEQEFSHVLEKINYLEGEFSEFEVQLGKMKDKLVDHKLRAGQLRTQIKDEKEANRNIYGSVTVRVDFGTMSPSDSTRIDAFMRAATDTLNWQLFYPYNTRAALTLSGKLTDVPEIERVAKSLIG